MQNSTAISAAKTPAAGKRSVSQPSRIVDGFGLTGPSVHPDPAFNAYRKDLADTALAGQVISSHYAEPLARPIIVAYPLRTEASDDAPIIVEVRPGDSLLMLDCTRGWAWGYGGAERRVGYVRGEAIGAI